MDAMLGEQKVISCEISLKLACVWMCIHVVEYVELIYVLIFAPLCNVSEDIPAWVFSVEVPPHPE